MYKIYFVQSPALGNEATSTFDKNGNVKTRTDAKGGITSYEYDALDHMVKETDPRGNRTSYEYDVMGNLTAIIDAKGNTTHYEYDLNNRITKVIDPRNGETVFTYDENRNLLSVTDAKEQTTSFSYDELNRKISMANSLGEHEIYDYDNNGNLIKKTRAHGDSITYEFDNFDRLTTKILSTGETTAYTYDQMGRTTNITNPYSSLSFSYDRNSRLTAVYTAATAYQPETMIAYTYDANGNRLSMTDPFGGVTSYRYGVHNNLVTLTAPGGQLTSFSYDENNRRISKVLPNNLHSFYEYNLNGDLTSLNHNLGATTLSNYSYEYDTVGNRTKITDPAGVHDYTYDQLNQLLQADHPVIPTETFTYDPVGNRLSSADSSDDWEYNTGNRLLDDGTFTYNYINGCLTQKTNKSTGEVTTYTYNPENQLTGITTPSSTIFYYYDVLGRRICKEVQGVKTYFIYDEEDILFTLDDNYNIISRYTHGPGIDEPIKMDQEGHAYYYLADGLGSITHMVDAAGIIQQEYRYDSFGNILSMGGVSDNPYTYTGREYDPESGLYYNRARYYDPQIGRFLAPDPIGFRGGALNLYQYARNNPVNWIDLWGLQEKAVLGIHSDVGSEPSANSNGEGGYKGAGTFLNSGHAWISVYYGDGTYDTFGSWPDSHWSTVDNGDATDIRRNHEPDRTGRCNRYYELSPAQIARLRYLINNVPEEWGYTSNCSSWVENVVREVIGEDIGAGSVISVDSPSQLSGSINLFESVVSTSLQHPLASGCRMPTRDQIIYDRNHFHSATSRYHHSSYAPPNN